MKLLDRLREKKRKMLAQMERGRVVTEQMRADRYTYETWSKAGNNSWYDDEEEPNECDEGRIQSQAI